MSRYRSRTNALEDLGNLRTDIARSDTSTDNERLSDLLLENPELAREYKSTAFTLLIEGRNLLTGKERAIQKLAGTLMRVHFSDKELEEAIWRYDG